MKTPFEKCIGLIIVFLMLLSSCKEVNKKTESVDQVETRSKSEITFVTKSMEFIGVDTIMSGWNEILYENQSTEPHFILLDKYPEGRSIKDTKSDILPPFDEGMALLMEGKNEEAMEAFGKLPEWFGEIVFSGGTGLISPRKTAITHVDFKPGYYIMECYVKMPDGRFHTSMGMAKELIVTEENSGNNPPDSNVDITISSQDGISYSGDLASGSNVFSVTYGDQIVHENFVGHDINLVRMEEGADLEALESWMNWATPEGLMSSTAPDGFTFLGGTNDAPAGSVHYFEAELTPGKYVLVSEVPNADEKGMLKTFTVGN